MKPESEAARRSRLARKKRYRERNRERIAAYLREWRQAHHDAALVYWKRYAAENRDKVNAKARRYRERNRVVIKVARHLGVRFGEARRLLGERHGQHSDQQSL